MATYTGKFTNEIAEAFFATMSMHDAIIRVIDMRIISWNCNGKLRDKFSEISKYDADIYVIQECENPRQTNSLPYKQFAANYIWKGDLSYKGLGVFAKPGERVPTVVEFEIK